jgi:hypothetical protein
MSTQSVQELMRQEFERISAPNFGANVGRFAYERNSVGEYFNPTLEDHWQTFQEGWEAAMNQIHKYNIKANSLGPTRCRSCGDKLMSDMTELCYTCSQTRHV